MKRKFDSPQTARTYLEKVGAQADAEINIFESALAIAAVNRPSIVIDKYRIHLDKMAFDLQARFDELCASENSDDARIRMQALRQTFAGTYDYTGDEADYHNLQNIDIMRVIDRRMGMPITLCIVAIGLCRKMGWTAHGMNFPGHFLMMLEHDGERLIIDPFAGCKTLAAPDLRELIKKHGGPDAELSSEFYMPCSNRDILLRLQNNIKYRLIETEHYGEALEVVDLMTVFAPNDNRLRLDLAVLLSRLQRPKSAIDHLQAYIDHADDTQSRQEAMLFMHELTNQLN